MTDPTVPLDSDRDDASAPPENRTRRRAAVAIGALLVVAGIALAIWAIAAAVRAPEGQNVPVTAPSATAAASPAQTTVAPSAAPSATAVAEPSASIAPVAPVPPAADAPVISSFTVQPEVAVCPDERDSVVPLTFSWRSEGADRAWIGVNTSDASVQPTAEVATSTDGFTSVSFACRDADQVFTLTVQGAGGTVSSTIAVARELG